MVAASVDSAATTASAVRSLTSNAPPFPRARRPACSGRSCSSSRRARASPKSASSATVLRFPVTRTARVRFSP
jgi:hypothetical protein